MPVRTTWVLAALILLAAAALADPLELEPTADLRVRQEILDGVYHFAPESDRDWIRVRTRLGLKATGERHGLELRLVNEHRHYLTPDQDLDWDEVLVDRLRWRWTLDDANVLTIGRQDIVWPGGFLVLEGHPLDGSRSIFHDGIRYWHAGAWSLDLAAVHNEREAALVLIDDTDRPLTYGDETGLLARATHGVWSYAAIVKFEDWIDRDGDLTTWTASTRFDGTAGGLGHLEAEFAVQRQAGSVLETIPVPGDRGEGDGWALAGQAFLTIPLGAREPAVGSVYPGWSLECGGFYYSGASEDLVPFKAPWGNWPKWSELYIYTLLGESTPGRPHVAAWENIAAPRARVHWRPGGRIRAWVAASWLAAPEPVWLTRGVLLQGRIDATLGRGFAAHLLLEWLDPGPFHDGRYGLPPVVDPVSFLRWEVTYRF